MREVIKANFTTVPFAGGALLFLCALTFYYFAVLRIDYSKTMLLDLGPHPDATEYFAQAKALGRNAWPYIQIGYDKLPSRYPFGYPMLMLPWLKILPGADAVLAPFRTNQTMGLVLLLAASPVLISNAVQFHSPFKTGYDFWAPYFSERHLLFALRYIPGNALTLWKESTLQPYGYHVAHMFGTGTCFVPAFLLLTCVG